MNVRRVKRLSTFIASEGMQLRKAKTLGRLAVAGMLLTAAIAGCEKPEAKLVVQRDTTPLAVQLEKVRTQSMQRSVEVVGSLWANEEATISAKVAGRIAAIYKDMGEAVEGDEVLGQIEKKDYELGVNQKDLAMREALAKVGLKELPAADFELEKVPTVERAKLQTENADAKLRRGQQLHDQKPSLLSDQDFADLKTAAAVMWKNYDVELLNAQTSLVEAKARKADMDVATRALEDTAVRAARFAGVGIASATQPAGEGGATKRSSYLIAQRLVAVGEYVKEGTPLFRLVEVDPVKLRALAPEWNAAEIAVGQKVRVNVIAYPDDFWGQVSRINPQVDQASRTFQIEAVIPNAKRLLKPGGFAKASVQTQVDTKVLFVPQKAVAMFAGVSKVFVIRDGKAAEIVVETGRRPGDLVEIVRGLKGDESVIITGANRLAGGVPVVTSERGGE